MNKYWFPGLVLAFLAIGPLESASAAPILDGNFTATDEVAFINAGAVPLTVGWAFTTVSPLKATALGFFDVGSNGLAVSHQVGLWSSDGTLLAEATVDNTSIPIGSASSVGRWLFTDLSSTVVLPAGTYVLGASIPNVGSMTSFGGFVPADEFMINVNPDSIMMLSGVKFDGERLATNDLFTFPTSSFHAYSSFGPDLLATVPEPGVPALLGLGLVGLGFRWRRRLSAQDCR